MASKNARKKAAKLSAKEVAVGTITEKYADATFDPARIVAPSQRGKNDLFGVRMDA